MSSVSDQVRKAKNPQEALLAVAQGIDRILERLAELDQPANDGWGEWTTEPEPDPEPQRRPIVVDIGDGHTEIVIPEPSPEKYERRKMFAAEVLHLEDQGLEKYGVDDPIEAYAKGGPVWLYHGNRELFMSYAPEVRSMMVMDINEDDPIHAQEVGRDVLKDEEGITQAFVMETINGSVPE